MVQDVAKTRVSVCVATYNQERYIKDCIMSVIAQQSDVELEILVGNDCSSDGTLQILEGLMQSYPTIIKIFTPTANLGPSLNYQHLIGQATGEMIAHLDGDDFWLPGKLASQVSFLHSHPECSAVYTNAAVVTPGVSLVGIFNNQLPEIQDLGYLMHRGNYLNYSSLLYRSIFKNEILSISPPFVDYRIHCRLAIKGNLGYINRLFVFYRTGVQTSVLIHMSEFVRETYWHAILEVGSSRISADAWNGAVRRFTVGIIWAGIRAKNPRYIFQWSKRIAHDIEASTSRIFFLGLINFFYLSIQRVYRNFFTRFDRRHVRITSWR